jgi:hypothetical protein
MASTLAFVLAGRRYRASKTPAEKRAWGLRLQATKGGRAVQEMYRARGIVDPCRKARETRSRLCAARRRAKEQYQEGVPMRMPEPTRSKVLDTGW